MSPEQHPGIHLPAEFFVNASTNTLTSYQSDSPRTLTLQEGEHNRGGMGDVYKLIDTRKVDTGLAVKAVALFDNVSLEQLSPLLPFMQIDSATGQMRVDLAAACNNPEGFEPLAARLIAQKLTVNAEDQTHSGGSLVLEALTMEYIGLTVTQIFPELSSRFLDPARLELVLKPVMNGGDQPKGWQPFFILPFEGDGTNLNDLSAEKAKEFFGQPLYWKVVNQIPEVANALEILKLLVTPITHRDVKLSNIVLDKEGFLKVIDFGIALVKDMTIHTSNLKGTLVNMPPEQYLAKRNGQTPEGNGPQLDNYMLALALTRMYFGFELRNTPDSISSRVGEFANSKVNPIIREALDAFFNGGDYKELSDDLFNKVTSMYPGVNNPGKYLPPQWIIDRRRETVLGKAEIEIMASFAELSIAQDIYKRPANGSVLVSLWNLMLQEAEYRRSNKQRPEKTPSKVFAIIKNIVEYKNFFVNDPETAKIALEEGRKILSDAPNLAKFIIKSLGVIYPASETEVNPEGLLQFLTQTPYEYYGSIQPAIYGDLRELEETRFAEQRRRSVQELPAIILDLAPPPGVVAGTVRRLIKALSGNSSGNGK